mmetsp:Transcript_37767/g.98498  ORF Transcript_37767/g.98498 Transcript_37767/m.98498 type:complete len:371 (+) Transcript_37767:174-1286(+)
MPPERVSRCAPEELPSGGSPQLAPISCSAPGQQGRLWRRAAERQGEGPSLPPRRRSSSAPGSRAPLRGPSPCPAPPLRRRTRPAVCASRRPRTSTRGLSSPALGRSPRGCSCRRRSPSRACRRRGPRPAAGHRWAERRWARRCSAEPPWACPGGGGTRRAGLRQRPLACRRRTGALAPRRSPPGLPPPRRRSRRARSCCSTPRSCGAPRAPGARPAARRPRSWRCRLPRARRRSPSTAGGPRPPGGPLLPPAAPAGGPPPPGGLLLPPPAPGSRRSCPWSWLGGAACPRRTGALGPPHSAAARPDRPCSRRRRSRHAGTWRSRPHSSGRLRRRAPCACTSRTPRPRPCAATPKTPYNANWQAAPAERKPW